MLFCMLFQINRPSLYLAQGSVPHRSVDWESPHTLSLSLCVLVHVCLCEEKRGKGGRGNQTKAK